MKKIHETPRFKNFCIISLLVLIVGAVYWPTRNFEFTEFDDSENVVENMSLHTSTLTGLKRIWSAPFLGMYIPVTYTAWLGLKRVSDSQLPSATVDKPANATVFHLGNIFVHILNALLAFALLRHFTKIHFVAFAGALLFALHPINIESVAWVTAMKDLLAAFFSLLALLAYIRSNSKETSKLSSTIFYGLFLLAFTASVLSKPSSVFLLPLILAIEVLVWRRPWKEMESVAYRLMPLLLISLFVIGLTSGEQKTTANAVWFKRPIIALHALGFYFLKLVYPLNPSVDYGLSPAHVLASKKELWIAGITGGMLVGALAIRRLRKALLLVVLFAAILSPVLGIVSFGFQVYSTVADRYVYVAKLIPAFALIWILSRAKSQIVAKGAIIGVLLACAVLTRVSLEHWRNNDTLFSQTIKTNPKSVLARTALSNLAYEKGEFQKAVNYLVEILNIEPNETRAHANLALILAQRGSLNKAEEHLDKAFKSGAPNADTFNIMGVVLQRKGKAEMAVAAYEKALSMNPRFYEPLFNIGQIRLEQGRCKDALSSYPRVIELAPTYAEAHRAWGKCLLQQGEAEKAKQFFLRTLELDPGHFLARLNLGDAYFKLGKTKDALDRYREAEMMQPLSELPREKIARLKTRVREP
jgi:protein O-mannosyl-transferase